MKKIELWSRDTDRKILIVARSMCILGLAALVGLLYPTEPLYNLPPINALISVLLLIFVWGVFHLLRPVRPRQTRLVIERVGIPAVWMLLISVFLFFVHVACENHSELIDSRKLECIL